MRSILLYSILGLLTLFTLAAIGLGLDAGAFTIERRAEIVAPAAVVFAQLEDLHRWNDWFPWVEIDAHVTRHVHSGAAKGVGAKYEWESDNKSGSNRLTLVESHPPDHVLASLDFKQGRTRQFRLAIDVAPVGPLTQVRFVLSGTDTVASKLFDRYKEYLGKDLDRALVNLKQACVSGASVGQ